MSTTVLIISIIIAVLVLYKLYSVLGFHDESTEERINKIIKNTKQISDERKTQDTNSMYQFQAKRDQELEKKLLENLDETSKNNLTKIVQLSPSFSLSQFIYHCDFLFTKVFEELKSKDFKILSDYSNDATIDKLKSLSNYSAFDKILIKVYPVRIDKIEIDENNNIVFEITISSDQMTPYKGQFVQQNLESKIKIGAESIKPESENKWIILEFDKI